MGLHPTCRAVPLQTASKIIALLDMAMGFFGIVWFVYMLGWYGIVSLDPFENPHEPANNTMHLNPLVDGFSNQKLSTFHKIIGLTLSVLFTLTNLLLFAILLIGVHKKHIGLCLTWFYIRCAVFVFKAIIFLMYFIAGRPLFSQIPFIVFMIVHCYGLWVVNNYVEELRRNEYQSKADYKTQRDEFNLESKEDRENGIEKLAQKRKEFYNDNPACDI